MRASSGGASVERLAIPAARAASAGRSRRSARPTSEASETDALGETLKVDFSIAQRSSFAQQ